MSYEEIIYLDHCSTTPMDQSVATAMQKIGATVFGNPSAAHHQAGMMASEILEAARQAAAQILGAPYDGVIFTSGATEANNMVLQGFVLKNRHHRPRILVGATEHKSVFETADFCRAYFGAQVEIIPVQKDGCIDMAQLRDLCAQDTDRPTLVAVMHMNNEIPAVNPIRDVAMLCEKYGYFLHVDAVQSYVRQPIDLRTLGANSLVISPHKFYGPKGCGILALRDGAKDCGLTPLVHGGTQEFGMRAGTPNPILIHGASAALQLHETRRPDLMRHMQDCQDAFLDELRAHCSSWHLTVPLSKACAGIVSLWFDDISANDILAALPHICINRGSSCVGSGGEKHSHVYATLGYPTEVAANILRVSFGFRVDAKQCREAAQRIAEYVNRRS